MTHTPGPYEVEKTLSGVPGFEIVTVLDPKRDHRYCRGLAKVYEGDLIKNGRANADLFAAAPDLLDAWEGLNAALMTLESVNPDLFDEIDDYLSEEIIDLRKVITKALGRPPKEKGKQ